MKNVFSLTRCALVVMSSLTAVTLRWSRTANQSAGVRDTRTAIISKKLAAGSRNKGSRPWCEEPQLTPQVSSDRTPAEFGSGRIYDPPPPTPLSCLRPGWFCWGRRKLAAVKASSRLLFSEDNLQRNRCLWGNARFMFLHAHTRTAKNAFIIKTCFCFLLRQLLSSSLNFVFIFWYLTGVSVYVFQINFTLFVRLASKSTTKS